MGRAVLSRSALLLSGGMDSFALAYRERPAISIHVDYGQLPAIAELAAARLIAKRLNLRLIELDIDLKRVGSGDLHGTKPVSKAPASDWWPFRNQALVTVAGMNAISHGVDTLMLGTVASDQVHKDGTPEFIEKMSDLMSIQEGRMRVEAPFISLSTVESIRESGIPFPLLAWAHSCHTGNIACGQCRGCTKHREVREKLGFA